MNHPVNHYIKNNSKGHLYEHTIIPIQQYYDGSRTGHGCLLCISGQWTKMSQDDR